MKTKLLLSLILLCCVTCFGQEKTNVQQTKAQEIILKKQIAVDDLESQVRDIPFAVVRVFMRYKMAEWLWKDGEDKTGRAEPLMIKAVDDLFNNESEIPNFYQISLKSDIFTLLELNSTDTAKLLKNKYKLKIESDLDNAHTLLETKDGEKLVVEKILKFLINQSNLNTNQEKNIFEITLLIQKLQEIKSSEVNKILSAILILDESGRSNLTPESLISLLPYFRGTSIPNDLRIRLYKIIINEVRDTISVSGANTDSANRLLGYVLSDISANAPNLFGEANALKIVLTSKLSKVEYEEREREKRINESPDELSAVISEAEKTEDESTKYVLYSRAARLALSRQRFNLAVDLAEKTLEENSKDIPDKFRKGWHDQFIREVIYLSLNKKDMDSANYAVKKMIDPLSKADSLCNIAIFYSKKQDTISAIDTYNEALKLTERTEISNLKFYTLFRLISTIQEIDKSRISEIASKIAENIDDIPTLGIDDKPETENYKNYVSSIIAINYNLLPIVNKLAKENKNEAINFANRINRKEIKMVANFALMAGEINFEEKLAKTKELSK